MFRSYAKYAARPTLRGQALSEFLVAAAVLVPLLILVPLLAKVADVNHTAIEASRYAAWERTVASSDMKSNAQLAAEVQRRFFENPRQLFQTGDTPSNKDQDANPLWNTPGGRLIAPAAQSVTVSLRQEAQDGVLTGNATRVATAISRVSQVIGNTFGSDAEFDLEQNGLVTARVGVDISNNAQTFNHQGASCGNNKSSFTCLERRNVILTDAWDAATPSQVANRTKAYVPASAFSGIESISDIVADMPFMNEWDGLHPGQVLPDVVPQDRLAPYGR
jgi:hypothetical protein